MNDRSPTEGRSLGQLNRDRQLAVVLLDHMIGNMDILMELVPGEVEFDTLPLRDMRRAIQAKLHEPRGHG